MYNLELFQDIIKEKPTTKLFFYKLYFSEVINNGGFDVVIGNPPYLRVQGIDKRVSIQYKNQFDSTTGSYDLYVLFVEKGLNLLAKDGILNYIMPHKWINSSFGKGLREVSKDKLLKFISFGAYRVFNASTYTSLVWFKNTKVDTLKYVESKSDLLDNQALEKYLFGLKDDDYTNIKNSELSKESWIFTDKQTHTILEKIKKQPLRVEDVFEYRSQGIVTTGNDIFYIEGKIIKDKFIGFSKALNKEIILEKDIVKPILLGKDVKRYSELKNKYYVIFPHYLDNDKTKPFKEVYFKKNYPLTYEYLINFKNELITKKRKYKNNINDWFSLTRPREIDIYEQNKIITPQLAINGYFTYDTNHIYIDAGCYSFIKYSKVKESYKFYLALLNSKVCWFFMKNTSSVFSGGYYYYKPIYINPFPLPKIENIEDTKPFEILVDYIMLLKTLDEPINEYVPNSHIVNKFEEVIDAMVYELYFKEEFENTLIRFEKESGYIKFIEYAKKDYASIEGLDKDKSIEIIHQSYQTLREPYNKIRNNLILIDIHFRELIIPIKDSL